MKACVRIFWKYRAPYTFIAPFFILYGIFGLYPLLYSFYISMHRWHGLDEMKFVGPANYVRLAQDPVFWKTLGNTIFYWVGIVPPMLAISLGLAVLLNLPLVRGKGFFRTLYILPYVTSVVVVSIVFLNLFETNFGFLNQMLRLVGLDPVPWLQSPFWAKVSVITLALWKGIGFSLVVYLGGLQIIPSELYEAASIDGANRRQQLTRITIPLLRDVTLFLLVIHTIGVFNLFGEPYLLTEGGPEQASTTLTLEVYLHGFQFFKIGHAAALSFVLFGLVAVASLAQLRMLRGEAHR